MPEESTPDTPEELSESAELILAKAKLKEAEAALETARTPFVDKLILRGVLPIALAIVGPWAALTFSEQGADLGELKKITEQEKSDAEERKKQSAAWRERMSRLEDERAAELQAMKNMVSRLDATLRLSLVQMAVARTLAEEGEEAPREEVLRRVQEQISLPEVSDEELQRLTEQSLDRMLEQKKR